MPTASVLQLVLGVGILTMGADALVRGATRLAARVGLSSLVIGLTVVAFGTSLPEVSVSLGSALLGDGGVALGNALGSNIFNILVVLGGSAVIRPLLVDRQLVRQDVPVMVATALLVLLVCLDGRVGRWDGILLVSLGVAYTVILIRVGMRTDPAPDAPATPPPAGRLRVQLAWILLGLVLLVVGARVLVTAAETLARAMGVSELIIGLTVVAAGTSLPELATSFVAAWRGERDIAAGNVVGSNIFNALVVLGVAGLAAGAEGIVVPLGVRTFDLPLMVAASVACLPIFFTGYSISRWEGWVFLGYYLVYLLYLVTAHTEHAARQAIQTGLLFFALPLTALTLGVFVFREVRERRASPPDGSV
ncbi:MAG: sodium:calcium antiporter [Gemmatimonadota bacterium]